MKSTLADWIGKGVVALACAFGAWLQTEYGVPLWLSILDAVLLCLAAWLVLWLIHRRKNALTEREKYLLGAMREQDQIRVITTPECVWAGRRHFYGEGERTAKDAPVAREYLAAFERLKTGPYLRLHEKGLFWRVTSQGAKVRDKLAPRYFDPPSDIAKAIPPKPPRRPPPMRDVRQRGDPAMG